MVNHIGSWLPVLVVVTVDPDDSNAQHASYMAKVCHMSAVPRVGDMIAFLIGKEQIPDTSPFGKVTSVDWHEGYAMLWTVGEAVWGNGAEASELLDVGWRYTDDPWQLLLEVKWP